MKSLHSLLALLPVAARLATASEAPELLLQTLSPFPNASFVPAAQSSLSSVLDLDKPGECPPCNPFNCLLPAFTCLNDGKCNDFNGKCICPAGFGGDDCAVPLCGSLADGPDRFPRKGDTCECDEGWTGINCNVCQDDSACAPLIPRDPLSLAPLAPGAPPDPFTTPVCYTGGYTVHESYQMCDVTNRKILDMLPGRPPQVTFACDARDGMACSFQFWIGHVESFYCALTDCAQTVAHADERNTTTYSCAAIQCECVPGRMLCGENGSVDIGEFLTEEIRGPATFTTTTGVGSRFEEPAMNELINDIFGDGFITLSCGAGECLRATEVPGFDASPAPESRRGVVASFVVVVGILAAGLAAFAAAARRAAPGYGAPGTDADKPPATVLFRDLAYTLPGRAPVLTRVSGVAPAGTLSAIIGASGAGKSTLLDLLAMKRKSGAVAGSIRVNGAELAPATYRALTGFVDQDDTLLPTLTVFETVLCSARLRLPHALSLAEKEARVSETLAQLGILHLRDSLIGDAGRRALSGGEKRRVSIACELVTAPAVLFLDEPTSGLDAYNAFHVVDALATLARTYGRTVIFTIHQPRSDIVTLFDRLLLLSHGRLIYAGPTTSCQAYFQSLGYECPPGFNIADYLVDLTMQDEKRGATGSGSDADPEQGLAAPHSSSLDPTTPDPAEDNSSLITTTPSNLKTNANAVLAASFRDSSLHRDTLAEIESAAAAPTADALISHAQQLQGVQRARPLQQLLILSGRSFKTLYRNPLLMMAHYAVSLVVALICAFLFRNLTFDIPGFQNRMGLFFFVLAVFGFGCLTTLNAFSSERLLFMRERANGYYHPGAYFAAKILFDVIPLRVIPPFVLGAIVYAPVGLVPTLESFWRFILVLVLFNLTASSVVLFLSIVIFDVAVANLVGSLVMLFNLLFAGLLINRDKLPGFLQPLETLSFFHAAFEALLVNEVRYLQLVDHRYGVDIEVPAATILSMFGFKAQAFWTPDVLLLIVLFFAFISASYVALLVFVRERR